MATGVNKVLLIGNIGKIENKGNITKASLATSNKYKNKSGEMVDDVSWHRLTFFGKLSDIATQYVQKGDKLYIEGTIKYGKYTDNNGVERYSTDIVVRNMQMLGSKKDSNEPPPHQATDQNNHSNMDDIPF